MSRARRPSSARIEAPCVCSEDSSGSDDRMVACEICNIWYHFMCINMNVSYAEELELFVCSTCEQRTGVRSIMFWEGVDTAAYVQDILHHQANTSRRSRQPRQSNGITDDDSESEEDGSGSSQTGDEKYHSDSSDSFAGTDDDKTMSDRQVRRSNSSTQSDSPFRNAKVTRALPSKRTTFAVPRASKRSKPNGFGNSSDGTSDPARSYCLAQLETVFRPIFTEHFLQDPIDPEAAFIKASQYAKQVEVHLFEHFAEPDRSGTMAVGHKYKTQFRMLTFNLEKPDRQSLRRRIGQGELRASELSEMSNVDLASEQQKKEMEDAHQESLHHSILDAYTIDRPLRKLTHKGEEEIEDVSKEDKESSTWSSRITSLSPHDGGQRVAASPSGELHTRDASLGLLKEKPGTDSPITDNASEPYTRSQSLGLPLRVEEDRGTDATSEPPAPNGLRVLPPNSPPISTAPFDVNTIAWSPKSGDIDLPGVSSGGSPLTRGIDEGAIGVETGSDEPSVDHDFNELLELDRPVPQLTEPETRPAPIWSGELRMPSALGRPTVVSVCSHLIAGRPTTFQDAAFWANLFRSDSLTIEGRVPVPASESYLLNSRLNSGRELVAVSFTPLERAERRSYEEICDGLLAKGRHAVVLPWGNPPSATAPGKELYLVPLRPTDKPEYLDMLEYLSLPIVRSEMLLVGIFILHKARKTSFTPSVQPTPSYSALSGPTLPALPVQSPISLGFDISALTPEFIADILKKNPGIGAAATAALADMPVTDARALGASPYPPTAPMPSSAQSSLRSPMYRGPNWNRGSGNQQHTRHQMASYDRITRERGIDPGRVDQSDDAFNHR